MAPIPCQWALLGLSQKGPLLIYYVLIRVEKGPHWHCPNAESQSCKEEKDEKSADLLLQSQISTPSLCHHNLLEEEEPMAGQPE